MSTTSLIFYKRKVQTTFYKVTQYMRGNISIPYSKKRNKNQRWKVSSPKGVISYHRKKSRAKKKGKREARKIDTFVKVGNPDGSYYYIEDP